MAVFRTLFPTFLGLLSCLSRRGLSESTPVPTPPDESTEMVDWLMRYGYLPPPDPSTGQLQTWEAVTQAIRSMQRFAGIEVTGVMDGETLALMNTPRCSLPDITGEGGLSAPEEGAWGPPNSEEGTHSPRNTQRGKRRRRRRRDAGQGWPKRNISWRVRSFPSPSSLSRETVRSLLFYSLRVWAESTALEFHEVGVTGEADLQVDFLRGSHGDGFAFDGPGGAVAHAFFPSDPRRAGTVHFDRDENWTFRAPESHGTDLFAVAVHEFGHALGLSHSSSRRSIMRPYYQGPVGDPLQYRLSSEDQRHIIQIYGEREPYTEMQGPEATGPPALPEQPKAAAAARIPSDAPDRCSTSFDAVAVIRGETFFFKGRYFWRLTHSGHLSSFQPAQIHRFWSGLPAGLDSIDAAYERASDHRIVFFKGSQYWLFRGLTLEDGSPRPVSDFGLPPGSVIEGALSSPLDRKTYLLQGALVWRFDEESGAMDPGYPVGRQSWRAAPEEGGVDDVMSDQEGSVYVFKGLQYWKFLSQDSAPQPGYPHSTAADWLDCPDSSPSASDSVSAAPPRVRQEHREVPGIDRCSCLKQTAGGSVTLSPHWTVISVLIAAWAKLIL
ncbi:matrix metalloproteinase-17-like [Acipenser ruthenus]|uniref:matrix metalloproteinase-17-like n=1 Tax=Acipenser ruthenus TaxID=7906 RepID=UPI00274198CA|nr:matrix metalloproteinase-17-like [Acipenser ruthenus]